MTGQTALRTSAKTIISLLFLASVAFGQAGFWGASGVVCRPPYYCARQDLATVSNPATPAMGGLTGAGTTITDPDFHYRVSRVTDSTTELNVPFTTWVVAGSGSGDENHFNCLDNKITLTGAGGRDYPMNWRFGTPATQMYTGSISGGFYFNHHQLGWGRSCGADSNILFALGNGLEGVAGAYGTKLGYFDFTNQATPPSFVQLFDFAALNCLGAGYAATWTTGGDNDQFDNDFAVGFSNVGGQGTGVDVAVWRRGSGCRHLNLTTLTVTGDWGPTGAITGTTCNTGTIHNVRIMKVGGVNGALEVEPTNGCADANTATYVWFYTGLTYEPQCTVNCSGHWAPGVATFANNAGNNPPNLWVTRPVAAPGTSVGLIPSLPVGGRPNNTDYHPGWNALSDINPFCTSTYTSLGQTISTGWQNEVICIDPTGSGVNPYRFVHTFNTGVNQVSGGAPVGSFGTEIAVGSVSQTGKYYLFSSDWLNTLGSVTNGPTCKPNGGKWTAATAYGPTNILLLNPIANNVANYTFQATTPGTSGGTNPVWPQTVGATVVDGTVTWTNIGGPPDCRGDVFAVELF